MLRHLSWTRAYGPTSLVPLVGTKLGALSCTCWTAPKPPAPHAHGGRLKPRSSAKRGFGFLRNTTQINGRRLRFRQIRQRVQGSVTRDKLAFWASAPAVGRPTVWPIWPPYADNGFLAAANTYQQSDATNKLEREHACRKSIPARRCAGRATTAIPPAAYHDGLIASHFHVRSSACSRCRRAAALSSSAAIVTMR
jgi:hypothetical protein